MKMSSSSEEKSPTGKSVDKSNIKCVVVGDTMVGKTSLAKRLTSQQLPDAYSPTTFDNFATTISVDGKSYVLGISDTAGQEEFERLRTLAYSNCDVFLVCFSTMAPETLKHVHDAWVREVRTHAPYVPWVLVATHIDQRDEPKARGGRKLSVFGHSPYITTKEGLAAAQRLGAESYVECSALTEAGIRRLQEAAVEAVLTGATTSPKDDAGCRCACVIM